MSVVAAKDSSLRASQEVPKHCKDCGLCTVAQTYKMFPEVDQRAESRRLPKVLVLISQPHHDDDKTGVPLYGRQSGGVFLRDYLNLGKFRWYLSSMVRCAPPRKPDGSKRKASAKEIRACVENELPALLDQIQPEVVVLLGEPTMRGVLGTSAPRSLFRATGGTFSIVHGDRLIPVLIQEDPICHVMWQEKVEGGKDLAEKYERLFEKVQKITVDGSKTEGYDYTLIDTPQKMARLGKDLGPVLTIDWEYAANELLPHARTFWHLQSYGICAVVTDTTPEGTRRNFIILPELCRRGDLWASILKGRWWRGQNFKTELQCFWIYAGLDAYSLMDPSMKLNGVYQIHDSMLWAFAQDHGRMGVGLKPQCMDLLGVDDWSLEIDKDLEEASTRLALEHKEARKNIQKIHKLCQMPELDEDSKAVLLDQKQQLVKQYQDHMRPEKSIHYGDARPAVIFEYNAGDGQNNDLLCDKQIELGWEPKEPLAELLQRALFVTTMVEREGLPVDPNRFKTLQKTVKMKYLHYTRQLLRFPVVRRVLKNDKSVIAAKEGGMLNQQALFKMMSPKRTVFLHELARQTGVFDRLPRSKKINKKTGELGYTLDEEVLIDLSGGEEDTKEQHKKPSWTPADKKTEVQQIWTYVYALRQLFDLQNNFIKQMEWYTVENHVRPDFRLAKVDSDVKGEAGGTATGRLAAVKINSQNIKKDPFLRWIFSAGVYGSDWFCADADYDRIEPVMMTQVAKIASWVKCFNNGWDLYKVIANQIYHLGISMEGAVEEVHARLEAGVPKELRENSKTRTLAIMYGESPQAFAARANIPLEEAVAFFKEFDRLYPEIGQYKKNIEFIVKAGELVYSPYGRPRMFTPKASRNSPGYRKDLNESLLQAYNFPIQSMASDSTLWKAYEVYRYLQKNNLLDLVKMINLIHDSVCFIIHKSVGAKVMWEIRRILEDTSTLPLEDFSTPLRCGFKVGIHHGFMVDSNARTVEEYQALIDDLFSHREKYDFFKEAA